MTKTMTHFTTMFDDELEREQAFITETIERLTALEMGFYVFMLKEPTQARFTQTAEGDVFISCDLDFADYVSDYIHDNHRGWTVEDSEDEEGNIIYNVYLV